MLLCEWLLVIRSLWCPWLLKDTCAPLTVSVTLSLLALRRHLVSLSWGFWPHSLCLVRVTYIRTRTSQSRSRVPSLALSRGLSLSLAVSLSSVALSRLVARLSLSLDVPLVSSLVSLVLRLGPRPPSSRFTYPLCLHHGSARLQKYSIDDSSRVRFVVSVWSQWSAFW